MTTLHEINVLTHYDELMEEFKKVMSDSSELLRSFCKTDEERAIFDEKERIENERQVLLRKEAERWKSTSHTEEEIAEFHEKLRKEASNVLREYLNSKINN